MHLLTPPSGGAFIFDKDGTLLDTEAIWYEAYQRLLARYDAHHDLRTHRRMMGASPLTCLDILCETHASLSPDPPSLLAEREAIFRTVRDEQGVRPLPGVVTFLEACLTRSIPLGIATSASRATTEEELRSLGWESWFKTIITADDVTNHKPDPATYLEAAKRLGLAPGNCIAFEDGLKGYQSASRAGMRTVFLADPRFGITPPSDAFIAVTGFLDLHLS